MFAEGYFQLQSFLGPVKSVLQPQEVQLVPTVKTRQITCEGPECKDIM